MTITAYDAARTACELSGWSLSNLKLNKILYLAHMVYMGAHDGEPLVEEDFQAWDYGPVLPSVYHKAKTFGNQPVENVFHSAKVVEDGDEREFIEAAIKKLAKLPASKLIAMTHWEKGAWYKTYDKSERNTPIPSEYIMEEFEAWDAK